MRKSSSFTLVLYDKRYYLCVVIIYSMKFVYSLLHNGNVFYIGCTKDLVSRYMAHLKAGVYSQRKNKKIAEILALGELPEMRIIDYLPATEADSLEITLIKCFTKAGQPLVNSNYNYNWERMPKNIPDIITKKVMRKIIKYKQEAYVHQWGQRNKIYNFEYPDNPFDI